jgi:hypothetical protein
MNALPVGLEKIADPKLRSDYFRDLQKRGFDVAFSTFCGDVYHSATERFRQAYTDFAAQANQLGVPACLRIPTSVLTGSQLGVEEAQHDEHNKPVLAQDGAYLASPASQAWRSYIKDIITLAIKDFGFDWVVIEEPAYRVNVPGTNDRIGQVFSERYPDASYPTTCEETPEYLLLQQAKADTILDFCLGLAADAKEAGAAKVGIVPRVLMPDTQDKAAGIPRTACDSGQFAHSQSVDFILSDLAPGKVYSGAVYPANDPEGSLTSFYVEVKSYATSKPIITAAGADDDETVPTDFQQSALLSALAAGASGFTGHECGSPPAGEPGLAQLLSEAAEYTGRLGQPWSPVAFVFSDSACRHTAPNDYQSIFGHYWAFANHLAAHGHLPLLTFHAETLHASLAEHPEVRVLVFEEHFPLNVEQMLVIRDWWQGIEKRAIVAFGSGVGLSADPGLTGSQPFTKALPGVLELIGLRQDMDEPIYQFESPMKLRDVSRVRRSAFLSAKPEQMLSKITNVRRVFGSRASILYEADLDDPKIPIVSEWKDRTTMAIFCGFGLEPDTAEAAELAVRYALKECDTPISVIGDCTDGLLWNINKNGYIVMSNISDSPATAVGKPGRNTFWDCKAQKMMPEGDITFTIPPRSFGVYRVVGRRSKLFDIRGVLFLRSLIDGAGKADIDIVAGQTTTFVLRASPKEISVDGKASTITQQVINGAYHVTLQQCPPGDHRISLKW